MEIEVDDPEADNPLKSKKCTKNGGTTKAKNCIQGRIILDKVAFPVLIHELLDGKLVVKTKRPMISSGIQLSKYQVDARVHQ